MNRFIFLLCLAGALQCAHGQEDRANRQLSSKLDDPILESRVKWDGKRLLIRPGSELKRLAEANKPLKPKLINQKFQVFLSESKDPVAILGKWELTDGFLAFTPRFGFLPGTNLRIEIADSKQVTKATSIEFKIPQSKLRQAKVAAVFPSSNKLPANLLKFYIHFSAPMQQGNIYQHFQLIDLEANRAVELPFLELHEELWSRDGKRLTLFFDPGRIKRGLKPRKDLGAIFEEGKRYQFRISKSWPDQNGKALGQDYEKTFEITKVDHQTPLPQDWKLAVPAKGSSNPLVIQFDEPLDSALAQRVIRVVNNQRELDAAQMDLVNGEQTLKFTPKQKWSAGRYEIQIGSELEDLCGNRIEKAFDVDLKSAQPQGRNPKMLSLTFQIKN